MTSIASHPEFEIGIVGAREGKGKSGRDDGAGVVGEEGKPE